MPAVTLLSEVLINSVPLHSSTDSDFGKFVFEGAFVGMPDDDDRDQIIDGIDAHEVILVSTPRHFGGQ